MNASGDGCPGGGVVATIHSCGEWDRKMYSGPSQ